jgi:hypothetical protein
MTQDLERRPVLLAQRVGAGWGRGAERPRGFLLEPPSSTTPKISTHFEVNVRLGLASTGAISTLHP